MTKNPKDSKIKTDTKLDTTSPKVISFQNGKEIITERDKKREDVQNKLDPEHNDLINAFKPIADYLDSHDYILKPEMMERVQFLKAEIEEICEKEVSSFEIELKQDAFKQDMVLTLKADVFSIVPANYQKFLNIMSQFNEFSVDPINANCFELTFVIPNVYEEVEK